MSGFSLRRKSLPKNETISSMLAATMAPSPASSSCFAKRPPKIDQVNGNVGVDELHIIKLHDQHRQIGEQRLGDALGCPGKASKPGSTGRITKPLGIVSEYLFERVGFFTNDAVR
jgi:hypothetical protein